MTLALVLGIVIFAIIRNIQEKPKNVLKVMPAHVDLQIKDFVYTEVGEGNSKWEVKARTAQYNKKQNLAVFENVQISLTTAEKKVYHMTGDKGQMLTDKKDVEIKGNVVITSDSGDRFMTDYLKYSDAEKKFYTDAPVVMENSRMKLTGKGLILFVNKGELKLLSSVKAEIR
ncbi:MAG: LPS export ABC transporter periplasmic protein LptC [Smithella sp.]